MSNGTVFSTRHITDIWDIVPFPLGRIYRQDLLGKMQENISEVLVCNSVSCFFDCGGTFCGAPIPYLFYGVYILDMKQKDWNKKPKVD